MMHDRDLDQTALDHYKIHMEESDEESSGDWIRSSRTPSLVTQASLPPLNRQVWKSSQLILVYQVN